MEKILSREELMELQGIGNGTYSGLSDDEAKSIISTALALYDERDKMKAGIEKQIDKIENKVTREDEILQDLASIGGKGEK